MSATAAFPSLSLIATRLRASGCVFAEDEARLLISAARTPADLAAMVDRRAAGLPLEQVLGWAEFCGLRIALDPGVFVPRRRTEFLVHQAVTRASQVVQSATRTDGDRTFTMTRPLVVVDLCCGSGAVGAALAAAFGWVELHAVELDPAAVRCARRNLAAGATVYQGDLYQPLPASLRGRVDILVANAPYVPTEEVALLPAEARVHEPLLALDGGSDGLSILRRVIAEAPDWLAAGGCLLVEATQRQWPRLARILTRAGLDPRLATCDELNAAVVAGGKPSCNPEGPSPTG
jgi:release factor glutamine methyltransferase